MLIFEGGIGSGRTKEAQSIIKGFLKGKASNNHSQENKQVAIYVNLHKRDCQKFIKSMDSEPGSENFIVFT